MEKFELFVGCLGNGTTVCNKAVEIDGDFQHIAHIQPWGKVNFLVSTDKIPDDAMKKIETIAENDKKAFKNDLEQHFKSNTSGLYYKLLDNSPWDVMKQIINNRKSDTMENKIRFLCKELYNIDIEI